MYTISGEDLLQLAAAIGSHLTSFAIAHVQPSAAVTLLLERFEDPLPLIELCIDGQPDFLRFTWHTCLTLGPVARVADTRAG